MRELSWTVKTAWIIEIKFPDQKNEQVLVALERLETEHDILEKEWKELSEGEVIVPHLFPIVPQLMEVETVAAGRCA